MIADLMRANGATEHQAKFVEKELESLSKSPNVCNGSCYAHQEASRPEDANIEQKSEDFQKKLLESCAQQISVIAEANRLEMEKKFEALRQQACKSEKEVTKTVDKAAPQVDKADCCDEKGPATSNIQAPSGPASNYAQHQSRGEAFACWVCSARFASNKKLQEHLKIQDHYDRNNSNSGGLSAQTRDGHGVSDRATQPDDMRLYVCRICTASFPTNAKFQTHLSATGHRYPKKLSHLPVASR